MAFNWFSPNATQTDSSFDYDTAAAQIARQRSVAQALQQLAMTPQQGQLIRSGDFTGYAGGPSGMAALARVVAGIFGAKTSSDADASQKQLSQDSINALQNALSNPSWAQAERDKQIGVENDEQNQRELNRMNDAVQAGQQVGAAGQDDQSGAQSFPVSSGAAVGTPLPVQSVSPQPKPVAAPFVSGGGGVFTGGAGGSWGTPQAAIPPAAAAGAPISPAVVSALSNTSPAPQAQPPVKPAVPPMPVGAPPLVPPPGAQATPPAQPQPAPQPDPNALTPQQQAEVAIAQQRTAAGLPVSDSRMMTDQAAATAQPTFAQQVGQLAALQRTGPMGQQLASGMLQSMFSKDWGEVKNGDGATVAVYNKRNPSEIVAFNGVGPGSKTIEAGQNIIKNTNCADPQAASYANQQLTSLGLQPVTPQQGANMGMSPTERGTQTMQLSKAQGDLASDIATSRNNIAMNNKAIADGQRIFALSAAVGKQYPAAASFEQLFSKYAKSDPQVQELQQLFAQNTLQQAREALQGQGRLNKQEYAVFQEATPNMQMNPAAVARLVEPSINLLQSKNSNEQAIYNERMHRYQVLGGDPSVFGQQGGSGSVPSSQGMSPAGRAPGNYNF